MLINYDWEGYLINHLLSEDHEHYREGDRFPGDVDWNKATRVTLIKQEIEVRFLRVAKLFLLSHDPDTQELLEQPIPIVIEKYDYGTWASDLPEKQDKLAYFFQGVEQGDGDWQTIISEEYKLIPRNKTKAEDKEAIATKRREKALAYLKGRGKEIDIATNNQLGLQSKIVQFFDEFYLESARYIQSGSTEIINVLNSSSQEWLNIQLPELGTIREETIKALSAALSVPTELEINTEIEKYI